MAARARLSAACWARSAAASLDWSCERVGDGREREAVSHAAMDGFELERTAGIELTMKPGRTSATASAAAREMTLFTDVGDSDWSTDSTVGSSPWARAKAPSAFPTGVAGSVTPPPPPGVTSGKRISVASGR